MTAKGNDFERMFGTCVTAHSWNADRTSASPLPARSAPPRVPCPRASRKSAQVGRTPLSDATGPAPRTHARARQLPSHAWVRLAFYA